MTSIDRTTVVRGSTLQEAEYGKLVDGTEYVARGIDVAYNDIQIFSSGPEGAEWEMGKKLFHLMQEERLFSMIKSAGKGPISDGLYVLADTATESMESME